MARAGDATTGAAHDANARAVRADSGKAPSGAPQPPTRALIARQYSRLPLSFEPNKGQASGSAKFVAHGNGFSISLSEDETLLLLPGKPPAGAKTGQPADTSPANLLRMRLVGANGSATLEGQHELTGKSNYLIGNDPSQWHTGIPNYAGVMERNVYKGIDLFYYGNQHQLEYDVDLAPGADPRAVRWSVEGAGKLAVDSKGALVMAVDGGEVRLEPPVAYQNKGGSRESVPARYALVGKHTVGLEVGSYDRSRKLVVDPVLSYSTYLGGSDIDGASAIAVAADQTSFIAGSTFSINFPTQHALQPNVGGPVTFPKDAFVAKLSADGSTLLYATYLGGSFQDIATAIAVDNLGEAYVAGWTFSHDFPATPDSFNPACGGDGRCGASFNQGGLIVSNGFVSKLNPEGSSLIYSGFVGYYEYVLVNAIAVDQNQVAYVTGSVTDNGVPTTNVPPPPPFPITTIVNPVVTTIHGYGGGATDAFVTAISATGRSILYSAYAGGSLEDVGNGIATDGAGHAYVTGLTYSTNGTFPITAGAFQATYGGSGDAFLTVLDTHVTGLATPLYSSYLGGGELDQGNGVAVDIGGNAYITGLTNSSGLAVTPVGARVYAGQGDAFVAKFNPAASGAGSLIYFTYLGGSLADAGQSIALDSAGNAYVTGSTVSTDFPVTNAAFQQKFGGGNADAFVTKLDPLGTTLVYSSFLGGTNTDIGYGIAVDTAGNAYVAGQTCSLDFPLANPEQGAAGGNCDAFVSKVSILNGLQLNPAGLVFNGQSLGTTSQPQVVTITNGDAAETISISQQPTGDNPADFAETGNTCTTTLQPGQQCTFSVTFTPQASGIRKAQVDVSCSTCGAGGITYVLNLTGQSSTLTLSRSSLSFGTQLVGTTSSPISVTATNNGTTPLTFSSITASGDFAETDDCTKAPIPPTTNCQISVTFTPATAGLSIGALTLTDNATGSPQVILATGAGTGAGGGTGIGGAGFALNVAQPNPPPSAPAGQSIAFNLNVLALSGTVQEPVTLGCAPPLPVGITCSASQNPVLPTSAPGTPVTLLIGTALRTSAPPATRRFGGPYEWRRGPALLFLGILLMFLVLTLYARAGESLPRRRAFATMLLTIAVGLALVGCSGGGSTANTPAGTPAGTYQVTVVGAAGSTTQSVTVSFQVK